MESWTAEVLLPPLVISAGLSRTGENGYPGDMLILSIVNDVILAFHDLVVYGNLLRFG